MNIYFNVFSRFPEGYKVPELYRTLREACRKNFSQVSAKSEETSPHTHCFFINVPTHVSTYAPSPHPTPPHPTPPPPGEGQAPPSLWVERGGRGRGEGVGWGGGRGICLYVCVMFRNINREVVSSCGQCRAVLFKEHWVVLCSSGQLLDLSFWQLSAGVDSVGQ